MIERFRGANRNKTKRREPISKFVVLSRSKGSSVVRITLRAF